MHDFLFYCLIPILAGIPVVLIFGVLVIVLGVAFIWISDNTEKVYRRFKLFMDERGGVKWSYVFKATFVWIVILAILWMFGWYGLILVFE